MQNNVGTITKNDEFNGVVVKIVHDGKDIPTVTLCGQEYVVFPADPRFTDKIDVGGTFSKKKGMLRFTLIKSKTGEVIDSR